MGEAEIKVYRFNPIRIVLPGEKVRLWSREFMEIRDYKLESLVIKKQQVLKQEEIPLEQDFTYEEILEYFGGDKAYFLKMLDIELVIQSSDWEKYSYGFNAELLVGGGIEDALQFGTVQYALVARKMGVQGEI